MNPPPNSRRASGRRRVSKALSTNVPRLTFLLPGHPQWNGGRRVVGGALAAVYIASASASLLLWGSLGGWLLATAMITLAFSWMDAARQNPFSGMTPTPILAVTGGSLSLAVHAPIIAFLSLIAWPSYGDDPQTGSYLVNRLAYKDRLPSQGQWVWLDGSVPGIQNAVRVIAVAGQSVVWKGKRWFVDGAAVDFDFDVSRMANYPRQASFIVPGSHVLVDPGPRSHSGDDLAPLIMVESDHIIGRVWARSPLLW